MVADVFGYYAWQAGLSEINLLQANRMPFKGWVGSQMPTHEQAAQWQGCVVARPDALPFEPQSIDLLVLPHAFECTAAQTQVLRHAALVLVPDSRLVISSFQPWRTWAAPNRLAGRD